MIFDCYPDIDKVVAGFIWLKDGIKFTQATFLRKHKDRLWNVYLPTVERVEQSITSGQWPEKPGGLCGAYCPVLDCNFNGRSTS